MYISYVHFHMYISICTFPYVHFHMYISMCTFPCVHFHMYISIFICTFHMYISICTFPYVDFHMYISICTFSYVHFHMYISISELCSILHLYGIIHKNLQFLATSPCYNPTTYTSCAPHPTKVKKASTNHTTNQLSSSSADPYQGYGQSNVYVFCLGSS